MFLKRLKFSVEKMGFKYSMIDYFKSLFIYSFLITSIAYFHKLNWLYISLLLVSIILLLPFIIFAQFKYIYEFRRFNDLCLYLKQMIIQYKTHHKIYVALEKTMEAFDGNVAIVKSIKKAMTLINEGKDYKEALSVIEKQYHNRYIQKIHSYLILGEQIGGNHIYAALNNIDYEEWQNDILTYQKQKNTVRKTNIYFTILSICISLFCIVFFPEELMRNLFTDTSFQLITWLYFEIMFIAHVLVTSGLTGKWGEE